MNCLATFVLSAGKAEGFSRTRKKVLTERLGLVGIDQDRHLEAAFAIDEIPAHGLVR
jgi:hypothetical protein